MKKFKLLPLLIAYGLVIFTSCDKKVSDPVLILQKSYEKCQSIENGYYEMTHLMKYMSDKDTVNVDFNCFFKKNPTDSIYSSIFKYDVINEGSKDYCFLYNGNDYIDYSYKNKKGTNRKMSEWAAEVKSIAHNRTFYSPFSNRVSHPVKDSISLVKEEYTPTLLPDEIVNGNNCYHVSIINYPEYDSSDMIHTLSLEMQYWINQEDMLPVQYSIRFVELLHEDTLIQYEQNSLSYYEINNLTNDSVFQLSAIPDSIEISDYVPWKRPDPLEVGSKAPDWTFTSITNDTITLSDLKGNLILIDFFYKSCYPCILALPALQELHEKYKDKGLQVIGMDPFDDIEKDEIDVFMEKQGVTYTVLLGSPEVSKAYHVYGYPNMFLLDKQGKILMVQEGYGEGVEDEIEKVIIENL